MLIPPHALICSSSTTLISPQPKKLELITMAGGNLPPVQVLDKPEDLKKLLKEDRGDDCLGCKVIGG